LTVRIAARLSPFAHSYAGRACRRLRSLDLHASLFLWGNDDGGGGANSDWPRQLAFPQSPPPPLTSPSPPSSRRSNPNPLRNYPVAPVPFPRLRHLRTLALAPIYEPANAAAAQGAASGARPIQYRDPYRALRLAMRLRNGAPRLSHVVFCGSGDEAEYQLERDFVRSFHSLQLQASRAGNNAGDDRDDDNPW
jgi:hypothetical protein